MESIRSLFLGLKEKYYHFDLNKDGVITCEEFRQVLEALVGEPCPNEEWNEFMLKVDENKSGTIEFGEFLFALSSWFCDDPEDDSCDRAFVLMKNEFLVQDSDHDGMISIGQLQFALEDLASHSKSPQKVPSNSAVLIYSRLGIPQTQLIPWRTFLLAVYYYCTA